MKGARTATDDDSRTIEYPPLPIDGAFQSWPPGLVVVSPFYFGRQSREFTVMKQKNTEVDRPPNPSTPTKPFPERGTYKSYWEKLKDPRWQKKRLAIMERDRFACLECKAKDQTLHVHHRLYRKGLDPWDYDDGDLMTLCEGCHSDLTSTRGNLDEILGLMDLEEIAILNDFIRNTRGALEGNWSSWLQRLYRLPFCGPKSEELLNAEYRALRFTVDGIYDGLLQPKTPSDAQ